MNNRSMPSPTISEIRRVLGSCLSWEKGARTNPIWDAAWHPPNQTGSEHVPTYGSVDKRHVP
jgi:hypothetical protein